MEIGIAGRIAKECWQEKERVAQLNTINHSNRCLEAFHYSSAVSNSCPIDSCPNGRHPKKNSMDGRIWKGERGLL